MDLTAKMETVLESLNASPFYASYSVTMALLRTITGAISANVPSIQIPVRAFSALMVLYAITGSVLVRRAP